MGLFKRKPGGTKFGNFLRGVVKTAKSVVPGTAALPIGEGAFLLPETQAEAEQQAIADAAQRAKEQEALNRIKNSVQAGVQATAVSNQEQKGLAAVKAWWHSIKTWQKGLTVLLSGAILYFVAKWLWGKFKPHKNRYRGRR